MSENKNKGFDSERIGELAKIVELFLLSLHQHGFDYEENKDKIDTIIRWLTPHRPVCDDLDYPTPEELAEECGCYIDDDGNWAPEEDPEYDDSWDSDEDGEDAGVDDESCVEDDPLPF